MGFLIIDGNSILNRAFYGIRVLTNSRGVATNAVTGFMNTLLMLEKDVNPDMIAVAFDLKAPTFRHKMYDGYKANRKGMPDDLAQQLPYMKKIITAMGITIIEKEGFEADDIIGTVSAACADKKIPCTVSTGDRDSFQLVNDYVTVRLAKTKRRHLLHARCYYGGVRRDSETDDRSKGTYGRFERQYSRCSRHR